MTYIPIAKLDNFTGEEDDAQVWLTMLRKPLSQMDGMMSKLFKQSHIFSRTLPISGDTEAVTTYLECFYQNLCQIQATDANYFTAPQILNQFIRGLYSSILQCIRPMHPVDFQTVVTNARDFEAAKLEANHAQAINLVMNGSSELDSKLKQFSDFINQKLEGYLADNCAIYQNISTKLHTYNAATNLSATNLSANSTRYLLPAAPTHLSATVLSNLPAAINANTATELTSKWNSKAETDTAKLEIIDGGLSTDLQFYGTTISLLVTPEDVISHNSEFNRQSVLTNNIPPATVTNNETLAAIFPFEFEETTMVLLFSRATLEKKPIMVMYTDAKVNGHLIKLILDSKSAGSIITRQLMDQLGHRVDRAASTRIITADKAIKTSIGEIDDFPIEVNSIIIPIKVLVMEAT
ncbi:hypothetical protein G9A89_013630 [Geosiphon pyriformis]|nr:hypothetical protein G9A89_013630 [Geosiphon pyriformis]